MRNQGVETFLGAATDPAVRRLIAFGLGGIHVEVVKDVVLRLHRMTPTDAWVMVDGLRADRLLLGARGKPGVDKVQFVEILLRLSRLLTDFPEFEELDLNPLLASYDSAASLALDMRASLKTPRSVLPWDRSTDKFR